MKAIGKYLTSVKRIAMLITEYAYGAKLGTAVAAAAAAEAAGTATEKNGGGGNTKTEENLHR